jgi:hypothetical protein
MYVGPMRYQSTSGSIFFMEGETSRAWRHHNNSSQAKSSFTIRDTISQTTRHRPESYFTRATYITRVTFPTSWLHATCSR